MKKLFVLLPVLAVTFLPVSPALSHGLHGPGGHGRHKTINNRTPARYKYFCTGNDYTNYWRIDTHTKSATEACNTIKANFARQGIPLKSTYGGRIRTTGSSKVKFVCSDGSNWVDTVNSKNLMSTYKVVAEAVSGRNCVMGTF